MESRSIWLVRHGQASFGKSSYDNLSDQGHEQAFVLGRDLAARGITPDLLVSGSMKRDRQTLAEIAAGAGWQLTDDDAAPGPDAAKTSPQPPPPDDDISAGHARPVVPRRLDERWNELDHRAMLTAYKPAYKNMLVLKADMVRTLRPHAAFEKAVDRWSSGEHDDDCPESFAEFTSRTQEALTELAEGPTSTRSSSPRPARSVGRRRTWPPVAAWRPGGLEAWKHFTLAAVNTGVTRVTVDRHGARVLSFNEFAHLEPRGLVTNR